MSSLQPYMDWEANGPSYLTDIEVDEESPSAGDEIWHVAISWDDIKMMTLDQLDDAFRLDVIAADTPVWKEGMAGWQPLSVVAGMEDEEEPSEDDELTVMRPFPVPVNRPGVASRAPAPPPRPPGVASRAPAPPPRPPAAASRAPTATSRAPAATMRPPAETSRPPAATSRASFAPSRGPAPRTTMPVAPVAAPSSPFSQPPPNNPFSQPPRSPSAAPPASLRATSPRSTAAPFQPAPSMPLKTQPRMAAVKPTLPFGSPASVSSLPPAADLGFARSMAPPASYARPRTRKSGSAALWFFAPLALVGGLFAAYRNDLLLDAARSLHQEERYLAAERALLGVPGFGTPRSVTASSLTADAPAADDHGADSLKSGLDTSTQKETAPATDEAKPSLNELPAVTPPPKAVAETVRPSPEPAPRAVETHRAVTPERPVAKAAPPPLVRSFAAPVTRSAPASRPTPSSTKHQDVKAEKVVLAETDDDSAPAPAPRRSTPTAASKAATKAAASFGSVGREEPKPVAAAPKPPPKPAAPPPPKPVAAPPPEVSSGNSALDDAIKAAVKKKSPPKKKGPNADYDPLNSDI